MRGRPSYEGPRRLEFRALVDGCPTGLSKAVLDHIVSFQRTHGFSPSVRQLVAATGLATQTVMVRMQDLERAGYIKRTKRAARSIVVLRTGADT